MKLQMPQPCHENWNKMTQFEQGRFCNSCSKIIYDFTDFSTDEIVDFINNSTDMVCGRIQSNRADTKVKSYAFWATLIMIALFLLSNPIIAQTPAESLVIEQISKQYFNTLSGQITDQETGESLPFVNVIVKQNGKFIAGATTDFDGFYLLQIDPAVTKFDLHVSYIGFDNLNLEGMQFESGILKRTKNLKLTQSVHHIIGIFIPAQIQIYPFENPTQTIITGEEIKNSPYR